MSGFMYALRVPKERLPVLIGTKGSMKKRLEEQLNVSLKVDSEDGDVQVFGDDALTLLTAREVIRAISRGFNPEVAFMLTKDDYAFELVDLKDFSGTKKALIRKRGRVIGEGGKARRTIEELTDSHISVYGKTIGIIGRVDDATAARRAVEALLGQATHSGVYKQLEQRRTKIRRDRALWKTQFSEEEHS
jgi:ribosomal RNA assembly protein